MQPAGRKTSVEAASSSHPYNRNDPPRGWSWPAVSQFSLERRDNVAGNGAIPSLPDRPTVVWTTLERNATVVVEMRASRKTRVDIDKVRQLVCVGHPTGEHCCFVTRPTGHHPHTKHKHEPQARGQLSAAKAPAQRAKRGGRKPTGNAANTGHLTNILPTPPQQRSKNTGD